MKTILKLSIPDAGTAVVKPGDTVRKNDILIKVSVTPEPDVIHLSKLLHVKPDKITNYLKKSVGDMIKAGDVIAEKKSLFKTLQVRSPEDSCVKEIDMHKGTISLIGSGRYDSKDVRTPIFGKVKSVTDEDVAVELSGLVYKGIKGSGDDREGVIRYKEGKKVGLMDIDHVDEETILLVRDIDEEAFVKMEVIGIKGVITLASVAADQFSWIQVEEPTFKLLKGFDNTSVLLHPDSINIVVLEKKA